MTDTASRSHNRNAPSQAASLVVLSSMNPYTGEKMKDYLEMTPEEVERAIANAHQRFTSWRGLSFAQRAALLHRAAVLCRERIEMLATLMAVEMGKRACEGREE